MALAPLPARLSSSHLDPVALAREAHKFTVDTINRLKATHAAFESLVSLVNTLAARQIEATFATATMSSVSTAAADVDAGMFFQLKADTNYLVIWPLFCSTAAAATGILLGMNYTDGFLNSIRYGIFSATNATTMQSSDTQTLDALLGQVGVGPGAASRIMFLIGLVRTRTEGKLALRFATGVAASTATVGAGSLGLLVEI